MGFTERFFPDDNVQRLQRSILLFIILATLPCYCIGAILLGIAPGDEDPTPTTAPPILVTNSPTASLEFVSPTSIFAGSPTSALQSTPTQFIPQATFTRFNFPTATFTLTPSITPTPTHTTTIVVNRPPQFDRLPAHITLEVGGRRTVDLAFSDPDGDVVSFTVTSATPAVATVNKLNAIAFEVVGVAPGSSAVTITLMDGRGGNVQTSIFVTVNSSNRNPVFNSQPQNMSLIVDETQSQTIVVSDPDGDNVTVTARSDNPDIARAAIDGNQLVVRGTGAGTTGIVIRLEDGKGGSAEARITVTVSVTNRNPVFNQLPSDLTLNVGANQTVTLSFSDPDGDSVTFDVASGNNGVAVVTPATTVSFSVSAISTGSAVIQVNLSDGRGGTAQASFTVTVTGGANQNPVFNIFPTPISVTQGDNTLVILQFSDPDGDAVSFTAQTGNPAIATTSKIDNTSFLVQGVSGGQTSVTIVLNDGRGGTAEATVAVTVFSQ
jgi:hypothetical protein